MKKVLVTGGAGFIGSHLCDGLIDRGYSVTVFDNLDPQVHPEGRIPDYMNRAARFIKGDIRDYNSLKDTILANDYIFHFAAAVGVGQSQYQISKYVGTNIYGTANLLDILVNAKHKIKKLIVAASMSSYGEGPVKCDRCGILKPGLRKLKEGKIVKGRSYWEIKCPVCGGVSFSVPAGEETALDPGSMYAVTKKEQEETCMLIGRTFGIPVVSLRFFNVYGPRQSLSNPYTGVTAIFISRIKNNNPPVIFEDGLQTRDFVWVGDVVKACILALESEKSDYEIFNVGTGVPISILEIAKILIKLFGKNIAPSITYKFRKGDVRHCFADIRKIRRVLGFKPEISLTDGLSKLVDWSIKADARDYFNSALRELQDKSLV
ncbi:MAG: GDP-mannose 4,6-dehydratase [Candidatus Omnitrophica bacterium]|nr:GDP-mannose 4,6-dehydratase [Candidatus Omnitrophota bacterium]